MEGARPMKQARLAAITIIFLTWHGLCRQAQADPIVGSIEFFGSATPSGSSLGPPVTLHFNDLWHTLAGSGVYATAGIPSGTPATFNDFGFTGDGLAAALTASDLPLWTFSFNNITYSFDLLSLTNGHTESGSMAFTGSGVVHATGFDDTPGTIALQGAGQNFVFNFSSSTTASVPEGRVNTLLILGFAMAAASTLLKKQQKA
jgi:hypothetical protein